MKKRILCMLLCICMLIGVLPAQAVSEMGAAGTPEDVTIGTEILGDYNINRGNDAFDGKKDTAAGGNNGKNGWMAFRIHAPIMPEKAVLFSNLDDPSHVTLRILKEEIEVPQDYSLDYGSEDIWTVIGQASGDAKNGLEIPVTEALAGRVFRLDVFVSDNTAPQIAELEFYKIGCQVSLKAASGKTMKPMVLKVGKEAILPAPAFEAPAGQMFQKWEVASGEGVTITGNKITVQNDNPVTLQAVYADIPAGQPTSNGDGTHSIGNQTFMCTVDHYEDLGAAGHRAICACGYEIQTRKHVSNGKFTDCKDGHHHKLCVVCGNEMEKAAHVPGNSYTQLENNQHHAACTECGAALQPENCVPSLYWSLDNNTHEVKCKCGNILEVESCQMKKEADWPYEHTFHRDVCQKCGSHGSSERELHRYQYVSEAADQPGWALFRCQDCSYEIKLPYSEQKGMQTVAIQTETNFSNECWLLVHMADGDKKLSLGNGKKLDKLEIPADKAFSVKLIHRGYYTNDAVVSITGSKGQAPFVVCGNLKELRPNEVIYTYQPKAEPLDFYELDLLLGAVPKDLSKYTEKSVYVLNQVLKSIPDREVIQSQQRIDEEAAKLKQAIDGLALEPGDPEKPQEIALNGKILEITDQGFKLVDPRLKALTPEQPYHGEYIVTGTGIQIKVLSGSQKITVKDLTLVNPEGSAFDLAAGASVQLQLEGENRFNPEEGQGCESFAAVHVPYDADLMIGGQGSLTCRGADNGAGIGGNQSELAGNIIIHSGNIQAYTGENAAGIGGGIGGGFSEIRIYGGTVAAEGVGNHSAGIGVGNDGEGGRIRIYGGEVTGKGRGKAAGIGGNNYGGIELLEIYGGQVTGTADKYGAGIGMGDDTDPDMIIRIYGGTVTGESTNDGAGIGSGDDSNGKLLMEVYGGTVTGKSTNDGAGIGGGDQADGEVTIRIFGGKVTGACTTTRGDGAGIGSGEDGSNPINIEISGGIVTGISDDGAGIGGGDDSVFSDRYDYRRIKITGGIIYVDSDDAAGIGAGDCESDPGMIEISNAVIFCSTACDDNIGAPGRYAVADEYNYVKLQNVTIFEGGKALPDFWDIGPDPITLDGEELQKIVLHPNRKAGPAQVILPNGEKIPSYVVVPEGEGPVITMLVAATLSSDPADYQVLDALADYTAVKAAIARTNILDKTRYSNYDAVEKAIAAVKYDLTAGDQAAVDGYAKAINDAIDALTYRSADYSAVDQAIAEAQALTKSDYVDFTQVDAAIAAVVRGKTCKEQAAVDGYAKAISDAIAALQKKPEQKPEDKPEQKVEQQKLDKVPESLENTPFNTVEKITDALKKIVEEKLNIKNTENKVNSSVFDVTLMIIENGVSRPATKEEIEAKGSITVILPYPKGTNGTDYIFSVAHMLTVSMNGMEAGDIETPAVTITERGLQVTLKGLSPVMIAYTQKAAEPTVPDTTKPSVPDVTEPAVPETTEPSVPDVTEPTVPDVTEPTVPETTKPGTPETGDAMMPAMLLGMMLLTAAAAAYLAERKKRMR